MLAQGAAGRCVGPEEVSVGAAQRWGLQVPGVTGGARAEEPRLSGPGGWGGCEGGSPALSSQPCRREPGGEWGARWGLCSVFTDLFTPQVAQRKSMA